MKASFVDGKISHPDVRLTPKELVKRHMFNKQHTISEEEWKQLQVGALFSEADLLESRMKSKALAYINSHD